MQRALVVSIHDVAPSTREKLEKILADLKRHQVSACSLLVVPAYHRQGRSLADPGFCSWLHEMETIGHEIVVHGFFHERARQPNESVRAKILTRILTADEGEFFDLSYSDALHLIREARHDFEAHGFRPHGFIAPAWLLGAEAERAVIDACMDYTTTLRTVHDIAGGRTFASQSLVYSTRSGWRRAVSRAWNRLLFRHQTRNPLLRLSIHPPDIAYRAIWEQISGLIDKALRDRHPMTYQDWLGEKSTIDNHQSAIQ
ncbi:MAG: polysaccharide deacetylase family protein [Chthoniobacterales bacterium]